MPAVDQLQNDEHSVAVITHAQRNVLQLLIFRFMYYIQLLCACMLCRRIQQVTSNDHEEARTDEGFVCSVMDEDVDKSVLEEQLSIIDGGSTRSSDHSVRSVPHTANALRTTNIRDDKDTANVLKAEAGPSVSGDVFIGGARDKDKDKSSRRVLRNERRKTLIEVLPIFDKTGDIIGGHVIGQQKSSPLLCNATSSDVVEQASNPSKRTKGDCAIKVFAKLAARSYQEAYSSLILDEYVGQDGVMSEQLVSWLIGNDSDNVSQSNRSMRTSRQSVATTVSLSTDLVNDLGTREPILTMIFHKTLRQDEVRFEAMLRAWLNDVKQKGHISERCVRALCDTMKIHTCVACDDDTTSPAETIRSNAALRELITELAYYTANPELAIQLLAMGTKADDNSPHCAAAQACVNGGDLSKDFIELGLTGKSQEKGPISTRVSILKRIESTFKKHLMSLVRTNPVAAIMFLKSLFQINQNTTLVNKKIHFVAMIQYLSICASEDIKQAIDLAIAQHKIADAFVMKDMLTMISQLEDDNKAKVRITAIREVFQTFNVHTAVVSSQGDIQADDCDTVKWQQPQISCYLSDRAKWLLLIEDLPNIARAIKYSLFPYARHVGDRDVLKEMVAFFFYGLVRAYDEKNILILKKVASIMMPDKVLRDDAQNIFESICQCLCWHNVYSESLDCVVLQQMECSPLARAIVERHAHIVRTQGRIEFVDCMYHLHVCNEILSSAEENRDFRKCFGCLVHVGRCFARSFEEPSLALSQIFYSLLMKFTEECDEEDVISDMLNISRSESTNTKDELLQLLCGSSYSKPGKSFVDVAKAIKDAWYSLEFVDALLDKLQCVKNANEIDDYQFITDCMIHIFNELNDDDDDILNSSEINYKVLTAIFVLCIKLSQNRNDVLLKHLLGSIVMIADGQVLPTNVKDLMNKLVEQLIGSCHGELLAALYPLINDATSKVTGQDLSMDSRDLLMYRYTKDLAGCASHISYADILHVVYIAWCQKGENVSEILSNISVVLNVYSAMRGTLYGTKETNKAFQEFIEQRETCYSLALKTAQYLSKLAEELDPNHSVGFSVRLYAVTEEHVSPANVSELSKILEREGRDMQHDIASLDSDDIKKRLVRQALSVCNSVLDSYKFFKCLSLCQRVLLLYKIDSILTMLADLHKLGDDFDKEEALALLNNFYADISGELSKFSDPGLLYPLNCLLKRYHHGEMLHYDMCKCLVHISENLNKELNMLDQQPSDLTSLSSTCDSLENEAPSHSIVGSHSSQALSWDSHGLQIAL